MPSHVAAQSAELTGESLQEGLRSSLKTLLWLSQAHCGCAPTLINLKPTDLEV